MQARFSIQLSKTQPHIYFIFQWEGIMYIKLCIIVLQSGVIVPLGQFNFKVLSIKFESFVELSDCISFPWDMVGFSASVMPIGYSSQKCLKLVVTSSFSITVNIDAEYFK